MMLFYPMLASTSVSRNVTLAICKTLERYLLLYETDRILKEISKNLPRGSRIIKQRRGFYLKESRDEIQEASTKNLSPTKDENDDEDEDEKAKGKQKPQYKAKVDMPFKDTFSVEPTYMQIESEQTGKQVIGIKVIPYPVKSEGDLVELLLNDRYAPLLVKWLQMFYRNVIRLGWALIHGIGHIPFLSRRPVTGKTIVDIIHAGSKHDKNIFVLLNQSEIERSDFLNEPRNIHRLFKQGWSSFVVADDVNQRVTFCMRGFTDSGFCTEVNYAYLLSSIGHDKLQIYNDLEDLQKKSSPFFRLKKPKKKIFESSLLEHDKRVIAEQTLMSKDIKMFSPKAKKLFTSLNSYSKKNDMNSVKKILSNVPKAPIETIKKIASRMNPNFDNSFKLCERVLKNSTLLSDNQVKIFSIMVALKSTYKVNDYKKETKANLVNVITSIRNKTGNKEDHIIKQLIQHSSTLVAISGAGVTIFVIIMLLIQAAVTL